MKRVMMFLIGVTVILIGIGTSWAAAPRNGLVAEYLFDGSANDTSGNGRNGTVNGTTLTVDRFGRSNAAYSFDGIDDSIDLGTWFNYQSFTISIWANPGSSQTTYAVIIDNNHTQNRSWVLHQAGGTYGFGAYNQGGIYFNLTANEWTHVAITLNSTSRVMTVYLNGSPLPSITGSADIIYDGTQFVRLGRWGGGGRYWNGQMDDVRIYNRALSSSEVGAVYHDKEIIISALTAFPTAGSAPLTVNFTCRAKSPNGTIVQYLWDFNGDGFADKITSVGTLSYKYSSNGTYNASVHVVDSAGYDAESGTVKIKVGNGPELTGKVEYYQYDDVTRTANIKLRVYNTGNVAAGAFKVNFTVSDNGIGPTVFKTLNISGLAAGQNTLLDEVSNTFPASIYGRQISIAIDSGKQVAEVDETNNGAKIIIGPAVTK